MKKITLHISFKVLFLHQIWLIYSITLIFLLLLPTACTSSKMSGNDSTKPTILTYNPSTNQHFAVKNMDDGNIAALQAENRRLRRDSVDFQARLQSCRNFNMELINKTNTPSSLMGLNKRLEDLQVNNNNLLYENNYLKKELTRLKENVPTAINPVSETASPLLTEASYLSVIKSMFASHTGSGAMRVHIPYWENNIFDIYIVDLKEDKINLFWKDRKGQRYANFTNLKTGLQTERKELKFATNGGMFSPEMSPVGLYIENGLTIQPIDLSDKPSGNFYMKPNGVFLIEKSGNAKVMSSDDFAARAYETNTLFATQSGPMLVTNGTIHPQFQPESTSKRLRSGVGIINSQKVAFVISHKPVNFYHFAKLFQDYLGCNNALYLDGTISQMHIPELNRFDTGLDYGVMIGVVE
ncbi:MAG: phosphodiester glycosidase family protein [Chitinophagales bacterium]